MTLKRFYRKTKKRYEYALVSKKNPKKVLQYFGVKKPAPHRIMTAERRVQYHKNFSARPSFARVKSHRRKGTRGVKGHKRRLKGGVITKEQRVLFDMFSNQPREYGGDLDFGKTKKGFPQLERFNTHVGKSAYVEMPDDYEVSWHIHPKKAYRTPSQQDIAGFVKSKGEQAQIIFSKGRAVSFYKTKKSKELNKYSYETLNNRYDLFYTKLEKKKSLFSRKKIEQEFIKRLKQDGFRVIEHNKKKAAIKMPVKVVE